MAYIKSGAIILKGGRQVVFDDIYPIKISYPFVLMSNYSLYNLLISNFIKLDDDYKIDDIYTAYHCDAVSVVLCLIKTGDDKYIFINCTCGVMSKTILSYGKIDDVNIVGPTGKIVIYTVGNTIKIKNYSSYNTICASNYYCKCIKITQHVDLLKIYLFDNNHVKQYDYELNTNIVTLVQEIDTKVNIYTNIKNYIIDENGLLYHVAINDNAIDINNIVTEYRFCDMIIADTIVSHTSIHLLLLDYNQFIISFDGDKFTLLDNSGTAQFCLKSNKTKSARI